MKSALPRALVLGALIALVLGLLHWAGVGLWILGVLAAVFAVIAHTAPWVGVRIYDAIAVRVRGWYWAPEMGKYHSFAGVPLQIEDDGRHVWVGGDGLMRALGRREPEDALAARHTGMWRRDAEGVLQLRVDAVVQVLSTMPGRDDPRVQRLRRYFERDVLFPAERRRTRR